MGEVLRACLAAGHLPARALVLHDLDVLDARLMRLQQAFPETTLHAVAIKANPLVRLLRHVVSRGCGLEAASIEEVELACAAGCPPDRIIFDSPAKTRDEIAHALALGVRLNVDNLDELSRVAASRGASNSIVGLRVNPVVGETTIASSSVAARGSQFGMPIDEVPLEIFATHPWLQGLHAHVGSQGCSLDQLTEAASRLVALRERVHAFVGRPQIGQIDLGGGLPVTYRDPGEAIDVVDYAAALRAKVPALWKDDVRLVTEFGRTVHANCGWAVSRVEYVKDTPDGPLAVTHLGADFMLRRAYKPQDWYHELQVFDSDGHRRQGPTQPHVVTGPLCFRGDIVSRDAQLPAMVPGDWLVLRDVGAYTLSMWSRYCSRSMPAVLGYAGRPVTWTALREAETTHDVVAFWGG